MNEAMRNAIEAMKKALSESDELKAYNAAKEAAPPIPAPIAPTRDAARIHFTKLRSDKPAILKLFLIVLFISIAPFPVAKGNKSHHVVIFHFNKLFDSSYYIRSGSFPFSV